jgi:hypothetical protein
LKSNEISAQNKTTTKINKQNKTKSNKRMVVN